MGAPRRDDSATPSSASVMATTSKPVGWCSWLMSEKKKRHRGSVARGFIEQPFHELVVFQASADSMVTRPVRNS